MFLAVNRLVNEPGFEDRIAHYIERRQLVESCPACDHASFVALDYPENRQPNSAIFRARAVDQRLWMCDRCGLIQVRNILPPDFYFDYLNSNAGYGVPGYPPSDHSKMVDEKKYVWTDRFLPRAWKRPKLLEVSSAFGIELNEWSREFDVTGVEPAHLSSKWSIETFPKLRGRIINDVLENAYPNLSVPFDAIVFMSAFRQVAHQHQMLRWLETAIRPGGYLIICEGTFSDFIFAEGAANATAKHFYHNKAAYYHTGNLRVALARRGFEFIESSFLSAAPDRPFDQSLAVFRFVGEPQSHPSFDECRSHSISIFEIFRAAASKQ